MAPKKKTEPEAPQTERPEAEESFETFVGSLPADADIQVQVRRVPSYLTPKVSMPQSLPPIAFRGSLVDMEAELRARYGVGRYKLYIRYTNPETRKRRLVTPTVELAPSPDDPPPGATEIPGDGAAAAAALEGLDPVQDALERLLRAVNIKAQTVELEALQRAASGAPADAGKGGVADPVAMMRNMAETLKALMPATDPLTILKNARDLIVPASGSAPGATETITLVKEVLSLARDMGSGGRSSVWELVLEHGVELLKGLGPYLPAFAAALRQVKETGAPGVVIPAPAPMVPASPGPEAAQIPPGTAPVVNLPALLAAVGGDALKADRLHAVLDAAVIEMQAPEVAWGDGWDRTLDFCEAHLPGFMTGLLALPPERVGVLWFEWDPRAMHLAAAPSWVAGLLDYARKPPVEGEAP